MISQLIKFIRVLSSEDSPLQISIAFGLALIAGLTPLFSLHNVIVLFILLFFRVNLAGFIIAWAFFSGLAYLLDPLFHDFGKSILTHAELNGLWTDLYNSTFWRLTRFNNTIMMGSLVVSLIAFIPLVLISNFLVKNYRKHILEYINNSWLFRFLKSSKWFTRIVAVTERRPS